MSEPVRNLESPYDRPGTGITKAEPAARTYALRSPVAQLLESDAAKAVILPLIPHGLDYNQIISEVYRAGTNDPQILKCTPPSIINAVATVVQTQLVVGKTIYLVPQRTKVKDAEGKDAYELRLQAWTDYRGDVELVVRSGSARHVDGQVVFAGDKFELSLGTNSDVVHVPELDPKKRGAMIGAYSIAYLNGFGTLRKVTWLPLADIEKVRKNSKSWSPEKIPVCPDWYAIKTAIHRNCKLLPRNDKLARVIALFDRQASEDRGDESFDELPLGLDPAKQIGAGDSSESAGRVVGLSGDAAQIDVGRASATASESERTSDADEDWTPPSQLAHAGMPTPSGARKRYAVEEYRMPFGETTVGRPLWQVSTVDLTSAYDFAHPTRRYKDFVEAAESVLELRRVGDIPEPTEEELRAPKPEPTA